MFTRIYSKVKIASFTLLLTGLSFSAFAVPMSDKCSLGQKDCPLPEYGGVYVPVSPSDGKKYNCAVRSDGDQKIFGQIQGRKNFTYGPEGYNADSKGKDVFVEGSFVLPVGCGEIYISNFSSTKGYVSCSAVH